MFLQAPGMPGAFFWGALPKAEDKLVIYKISVNCSIPPFARGMDGELKLASFYSSCKTYPMPGRVAIIHLYPLTAYSLFQKKTFIGPTP